MRAAPLMAVLVASLFGAAQAAAQAASGTIRVLSNAERAIVSLDGTDVGLAPLEIRQVRPGEHVVAVRAEGRGRREDRVVVEAGATAVVTLDLAEPPGGASDGDAGDASDPNRGAGGPPAGDLGPADPAPSATDAGDAARDESSDADVAAEPPSAEELVLERRGLTSWGAKALPRGRSTVGFGAGYPYLLDARVSVGIMPRGARYPLDAGVEFRTLGARWELAATARMTFIDQEPFSFGAFADAGGGSTYFDDSKRNSWFASGGVAASLTGLGAVTITGRAYLQAWSDRHCPGEAGEGDPTELCRDYRDGTLGPADRARVDELVGDGDLFERDNGLRAMISLAVELALSDQWNGWVLLEGAPGQDERAAYTDLFHGIMFEDDARSYVRAGFTYKF